MGVRPPNKSLLARLFATATAAAKSHPIMQSGTDWDWRSRSNCNGQSRIVR